MQAAERVEDANDPSDRLLVLRFLLVGSTFSAIYSALSAALVQIASVPAFPLSVALYCLMIPPAFLAQRRFTFRSAGSNGFPIYATVQVCCFAAAALVSTAFLTGIWLLDALLLLATAGSSAVASFLACRYVVFRQPDA